jgi:hypothetical protein
VIPDVAEWAKSLLDALEGSVEMTVRALLALGVEESRRVSAEGAPRDWGFVEQAQSLLEAHPDVGTPLVRDELESKIRQLRGW